MSTGSPRLDRVQPVAPAVLESPREALLRAAHRHPRSWRLAVGAIVALRRLEHAVLCRRHGRVSQPIERILPEVDGSGRTCHILANGDSVLDSITRIGTDDFVVAMNAGALLPARIDLYITELCPREGPSRIDNALGFDANNRWMTTMVEHVARRHPKAALVLKNLAPANPPPDAIDPARRMHLLREIIFPHPDRIDVAAYWTPVVDRMVRNPGGSLIQGPSTIVVAVLAAYRLGFRRIVIHGLDGRGNHFFHREGFRETLDAHGCVVLDWLLTYNPKVAPHQGHPAGAAAKSVLGLVAERLQSLGVEVHDLVRGRIAS
jgi:hypothetical protein